MGRRGASRCDLAVDGDDVWRRALDLYTRYAIDLDDLSLAAVAEHAGEAVLSFDGGFDKLRRDGLAI
jgi:predicted nucleic acid-binding protein